MAQSGRMTWNIPIPNLDFYLDWEVVSQNAITNKSTLKVSFYLQDKGGYGTSYGEGVAASDLSKIIKPYLEFKCYTTNGTSGYTTSIGASKWDNPDNGWVFLEVEPNGTTALITDYVLELPHYSTDDQNIDVKFWFDRIYNVYSTQIVTFGPSYAQSIRYPGDLIGDDTFVINPTMLEPSNQQSTYLDGISRHTVFESYPEIFTDEDTPTITYRNAMGDNAVSVQAGISLTHGTTMEIPYRDISKTGSSYTFVFTEAEKRTLYEAVLDRNRVSTSVRFFLKSTVPASSGSGTETKIDYRDATLNFINYRPTLDVTLKDTNTRSLRVTGNDQIFVRYASDIEFDLGADAKKGAVISSHYIQNGEDLDNLNLQGTLYGITDNVFYCYVMDNRNHQGTAIIEKNIQDREFIDYFPLTCALKSTFLDGNGTLPVIVTGKYFNGSFGAMSNSYTLDYSIRDYEVSSETWISLGKVSPEVDENGNYTYSFTIDGLDYTKRYELKIRVRDELMTEAALTHMVVAAQPLFDWGPEDFAFHIPVSIQGWDIDRVVEESTGEIGFYEDANGIPQYGNFEWSFRKWSSGLLECWCSLPITTNVSSAWGSLYTSGRLIETNIIFPREFTEPPVVTATLAAGYAGGILMTTGSSSKPVSRYAAGTLEIARGTALTNASYTINYVVRGRWK